MIFDIFFAYRQEGSKTYMQSYKAAFNSLCIQAGKHFFCKMKTRCRTGSRTGICCINILVTF